MIEPLEATFKPATKEKNARFLCPTCNHVLAEIGSWKDGTVVLKFTFDAYLDVADIYRPGRHRKWYTAKERKQYSALTRKAQHREKIDDELGEAVDKAARTVGINPAPMGTYTAQKPWFTDTKRFPLTTVCPSCKGTERRVKISSCVALE